MPRATHAALATLLILTTAAAARAGVQIDVAFPNRAAISIAADGTPAAGSGAAVFGPGSREPLRVTSGSIAVNYIELYGMTTLPGRNTFVTWRLVVVRGVAQWTLNPGQRGSTTWIGPAKVEMSE